MNFEDEFGDRARNVLPGYNRFLHFGFNFINNSNNNFNLHTPICHNKINIPHKTSITPHLSMLRSQTLLLLNHLHESLNLPRTKDTFQLSSTPLSHLHPQSSIVLSSCCRPNPQTLHLLNCLVVSQLLLDFVNNVNIVAAVE